MTCLVDIVALVEKHENDKEVLTYKDAVTCESHYVINTDYYARHSFDVDAYYASLSDSGGSSPHNTTMTVHSTGVPTVDGGGCGQVGVEGGTRTVAGITSCCDALIGDVNDDTWREGTEASRERPESILYHFLLSILDIISYNGSENLRFSPPNPFLPTLAPFPWRQLHLISRSHSLSHSCRFSRQHNSSLTW
jgi:hypothetical protein